MKTHTPWCLFILLGLMIGSSAPSQAEELHFYGQNIQWDIGHQSYQIQGKFRFFYQDWRILAGQATFDRVPAILQLKDQIQLTHPNWELTAVLAQLNLEDEWLKAQNGKLNYKGFQIQFEQAQITKDHYFLDHISLSHPHLPFPIQAKALSIYPGLKHLVLKDIHLPWGVLQSLTVPLEKETLSQRFQSDANSLAPEFQLLAGGLYSALSFRILNNTTQRLTAQVYTHPTQGEGLGVHYTLTPAPSFALNSRWQMNTQGKVQGQNESFFDGSQIGIFRHFLVWNDLFSLNSYLQVPALKSDLQVKSGLMALLYQSPELDLLGLKWQWLGASEYEDKNPVLAQTIKVKWPWQINSEWSLHSHLLAHWRISPQHNLPLLGGRTTLFWQADHFSMGHYYEQYASFGNATVFAQNWRFKPLLGHFAIWQINQDLALGSVIEWGPEQGRIQTLDAMVSYRYNPLNFNLYLKTLPLGVRLETHFEL